MNTQMNQLHTFAVCAYQDSPFLKACLKSLKRQTIPSNIIICTSTPSPYIDGLAEKYQIPVYVRHGKSDIQEDWNFAYQSASARLVTIAHQDDIYHKDYIRVLLQQFEHFPDMTVFFTDYLVVKEDVVQKRAAGELIKKLLRLPLRFPGLCHISQIKKSVLMFGNSVCCPSCTYHKAVLGEPLFTSQYKFALDWDTLFRLSAVPGRFICAETPLIYYRIHNGATTKECILDHRRYQEESKMFEQMWPLPIARLLLHFYKKAYDAYL